MKHLCILCLFILSIQASSAQLTPFILRGALKENRQQLKRNLINNTILNNLSRPLTNETEAQWQAAFWAITLLNYSSPWTENKIHDAFINIADRSIEFQRSLMEVLLSNYRGKYLAPVQSFVNATADAKVFAMCALYIADNSPGEKLPGILFAETNKRLWHDTGNVILQQTRDHLINIEKDFVPPSLAGLFAKDYLRDNVLLISLQRKNRNYPGIALVRDADGNFLRDGDHIFSVPILARSHTNLPGFLTNGNTPEGIFRMDGFDTSQSNFIGPTTNIQLTLPFEFSASHFYRDSTLTDSSWSLGRYQQLLPAGLQQHLPAMQAYYAGKAGRTEIIVHGTTVDPAYSHDKTYYPLIPTEGCLTTKEIWNDANGMLKESDQLKLTAAIQQGGGPNGYAIVINIDDQQKPVMIEELLQYFTSAKR